MTIEKLIPPFYTFFVALGLLTGILVLKLMKYPEMENGIKIKYTLPILVLGAIIGSKIPIILSYGISKDLLWTGKSYFGAVLGGFIFINIFKKMWGIKGYFGDRFTVPLCVSACIGKIGCFFYGCCSGIQTDFYNHLFNTNTIFFHPVQIYESIFELLCGIVFVFFYKTKKLTGFHFLFYFTIYMIFRFLIEFIRNEPKIYGYLTIYQIMALIFIPIFIILIILRKKENNV